MFDASPESPTPCTNTDTTAQTNTKPHGDKANKSEEASSKTIGTSLHKEGGSMTNGDIEPVCNQLEHSALPSEFSLPPLDSTNPSHHHHHTSSSNHDFFLDDIQPSPDLFEDPIVDSKPSPASDDVDLPFPELGIFDAMVKSLSNSSPVHYLEPVDLFGEGTSNFLSACITPLRNNHY